MSGPFPLRGRRVLVAGHRGMVGAACLRRFDAAGADLVDAGSERVDLRDQTAARRWVAERRPEVLVIAAAKVGGIAANDRYPADFLYDNLMIAANLVEAAHQADVPRVLFLGSSCIYPKLAPQPIEERSLLTGPLEPTNEWYAIAKIAGIKLCDAYRRQHGRSWISAMPTNLYGPGDNFHPEDSHVIPGLLRRFHEAKESGASEVVLWGTGAPLREFLHVDDLAEALLLLLERYDAEGPVNAGSGEEVTIAQLAEEVRAVVGFDGALRFDPTRPDGTPRKLISSSWLRAEGWAPRWGLRDGLADAYRWWRAHADEARG